MRPDIAKKLVERPRKGGGGKKKFISERRMGKNPNKWEVLPQKESCKKVHIRHYQGKYLSEYFKPLKGFLRKNVGRPWDKVNSEIREHLSASSTVQKHIMDHLYGDFVELNPIFIKGVPYSSQFGSKGKPYELRKGNFYVDSHGLLKMVKREKTYKPYKPEPRKILNDLEEYRKLKGNWFWVRYKHLFPGEEGFDVVLGVEHKVSEWGNWSLTQSNGDATHNGLRLFRQVRLAVEKRQLSKKHIRDEGLHQLEPCR